MHNIRISVLFGSCRQWKTKDKQPLTIPNMSLSRMQDDIDISYFSGPADSAINIYLSVLNHRKLWKF